MIKRLLVFGVALFALMLVISATPWGVAAQQTIRNITVDEDSLLVTETTRVADGIEELDSKLAVDPSHGNILSASGPQMIGEAKTVDGSALPNVVTEGQPVRAALSTSGVAHVALTNQAGTVQYGSSAAAPFIVSSMDPCDSVEKTTTPISVTADTVIISAASGLKNYICSIVVVVDNLEQISIVEGTGTTCGTGETALVGATVDANGMPFPAKGGFSAIGGNATVIAGKTANVDTCLTVQDGIRTAGFITWVQR